MSPQGRDRRNAVSGPPSREPTSAHWGVIVDHEKPFKGVEVGFDCSPNQVLAVCSLYVFLQRSNVYIMEILYFPNQKIF